MRRRARGVVPRRLRERRGAISVVARAAAALMKTREQLLGIVAYFAKHRGKIGPPPVAIELVVHTQRAPTDCAAQWHKRGALSCAMLRRKLEHVRNDFGGQTHA